MTARPTLALEIDEEGWPILSGMRADDPAFCNEIFATLRRLDPAAPASAIVAESTGKSILINAFAAPLVAQSVEAVDATGATWNFPGGLSHRIEHAKLKVDAFHRVHAPAGPLAIPALLGRAAHSQLLFHPDAPKQLPPFFDETPPAATSEYWESAYAAETQGWELDRPSPVLVAHHTAFVALARAHRLDPATFRVAVPGAGRGHDAEFWSGHSAETVAIDFARQAASEHARLYPRSTVRYETADALASLAASPARFDVVFEHTLYCAIPPSLRARYVDAVSSALKPGGFLVGVFWTRVHPTGPPFGTDQWELRERFMPRFDALAWELSTHSIDARYGQELWIVLRKKP